jgi:phosphohistidine phosphatase SixA
MPAALLTMLVAMATAVAGPAAAQADLIARMQEGGTVVFLRHALTDHSQVDTGRLGDRAGQRNLSQAGREQARKLGEAFDALGIAFSRILASPVYRARDTAELAFGPGEIEVTMDIVADDYAGRELGRMIAATDRLLGTEPPEGENLLLVGHRTPLEMVTGQGFPDSILPEGAMAVFDPGGDGYRLLGTVSPEALVSAAE